MQLPMWISLWDDDQLSVTSSKFTFSKILEEGYLFNSVDLRSKRRLCRLLWYSLIGVLSTIYIGMCLCTFSFLAGRGKLSKISSSTVHIKVQRQKKIKQACFYITLYYLEMIMWIWQKAVCVLSAFPSSWTEYGWLQKMSLPVMSLRNMKVIYELIALESALIRYIPIKHLKMGWHFALFEQLQLLYCGIWQSNDFRFFSWLVSVKEIQILWAEQEF